MPSYPLSTLAVIFDALAARRTLVRSLLNIFPRAASSSYIRRYAMSSVFVMQLQRVRVSSADALKCFNAP